MVLLWMETLIQTRLIYLIKLIPKNNLPVLHPAGYRLCRLMCPIFVKVIDPLHLQNAVIHLLAFHSLKTKYNSLKPCQVF